MRAGVIFERTMIWMIEGVFHESVPRSPETINKVRYDWMGMNTSIVFQNIQFE